MNHYPSFDSRDLRIGPWRTKRECSSTPIAILGAPANVRPHSYPLCGHAVVQPTSERSSSFIIKPEGP